MEELDRAVHCLNDGCVIAHATEAIFGLAARALDYGACKRVWKIKNRPFSKKFIVIFSSVEEVQQYSIITGRNEQKILETKMDIHNNIQKFTYQKFSLKKEK